MTGLANQQQQQSGQLFNNVAYPDISTASSYYQKLASGNPNEIQAAVGPAASQIAAQTNATEQNIQNTSPRGGTKLLGEEEAKISGQGQIGNLVTQAYTSAFPALAQIGGATGSLSNQEIQSAISGFQGAGQQESNIANEQEEGKASQLAFFGALAGAGSEVGAAAMG